MLFDLVFLKTIKELEGSVIHVKIVPFVLMCVNVCDYPLQLVCTLHYFWVCIENENVELFYKDVWGKTITICNEN